MRKQKLETATPTSIDRSLARLHATLSAVTFRFACRRNAALAAVERHRASLPPPRRFAARPGKRADAFPHVESPGYLPSSAPSSPNSPRVAQDSLWCMVHLCSYADGSTVRSAGVRAWPARRARSSTSRSPLRNAGQIHSVRPGPLQQPGAAAACACAPSDYTTPSRSSTVCAVFLALLLPVFRFTKPGYCRRRCRCAPPDPSWAPCQRPT